MPPQPLHASLLSSGALIKPQTHVPPRTQHLLDYQGHKQTPNPCPISHATPARVPGSQAGPQTHAPSRTQRLLDFQGRKVLGSLAWVVFIPALNFATLVGSITPERLLHWWPLFVNVFLT